MLVPDGLFLADGTKINDQCLCVSFSMKAMMGV